MLILNLVQEIQHLSVRTIDPESMPNQVEHMVQGDVNAYRLLPQD